MPIDSDVASRDMWTLINSNFSNIEPTMFTTNPRMCRLVKTFHNTALEALGNPSKEEIENTRLKSHPMQLNNMLKIRSKKRLHILINYMQICAEYISENTIIFSNNTNIVQENEQVNFDLDNSNSVNNTKITRNKRRSKSNNNNDTVDNNNNRRSNRISAKGVCTHSYDALINLIDDILNSTSLKIIKVKERCSADIKGCCIKRILEAILDNLNAQVL